MYCVFNRCVPKSNDSVVIIPPKGKTFVTGVAFEYSDEYPKQLDGKITKAEFLQIMAFINM